jgi:hypothetical protein
MQLLNMWEYGAWLELGKLFFFEECMGVQRYMAILREPIGVSPFWSGWPHIIASIRHNIL